MSYVYCAYMSLCDVVAPMGSAAHHVGEGRFLLISTGTICELFATMIAVTVGPAVLWGARGRWLGRFAVPTGAASASASAAADLVASIISLMLKDRKSVSEIRFH